MLKAVAASCRRSGADTTTQAASPRVRCWSPRPPEVPGKFTGSRTVGKTSSWNGTPPAGTIGWAHSLRSVGLGCSPAANAVYGQFWDHMHNVYKALVLPLATVNLDMAPELSAIDLYPDCRLSKSYNVTWRQLAAILGTRAPWFPPTLRDLDTISAWKPGDPSAIIPANRLQLPTRALVELAADEPDGSPAAAVSCGWPGISAGRMRKPPSSTSARSQAAGY